MLLKWIGGLCIILGSSGIGFQIAAQQRKEERYLGMLVSTLDFMECELQYRHTPLPDLCRKAAVEASGNLEKVLLRFADELDDQISPNVEACMFAAIANCKYIPDYTKECLITLGKTMGRFDIDGQIRGLNAVRNECDRKLKDLQNNRDKRLRSYQTLGICAGAGLAILFI